MSDLLPRERRALCVRALFFASALAVACGGRSIRHYEEAGGAAGEGAAGGSGGSKAGTSGKGSGGSSGSNQSGGTSTSGGAAGSVSTGGTGGSVSVGGGPSSGGVAGTAGVSTPGGSAGTAGVGGSVNMFPTYCDPGALAGGVKCAPGSVSILEVKDCYLLMGCTLGDACGQSGLSCDACVAGAIPPEELQSLCVPSAAIGFLPGTCAQLTNAEYPACSP